MDHSLEFVYLYLKYLSKWNKSDSLTSIINHIEKHQDSYTEQQISELYSIAVFEYRDTIYERPQRQNPCAEISLEKNNILSLEECYSLYLEKNRDEKINEILND